MGIERKYKSPNEIELFGVDWTDRLGSATLVTSTWTIDPALTQVLAGFTPTQTSIKVSGGALGQVCRITNQVTTTNGETLEHSIDIEIIEK
ncbi:MAG: hypothetical protein KGI29_10410 [Pseudomonadota bacterium]|nr:hypothetical protein [Pseudomonadota bacterium]MDE3036955.1 hypothetical protein [Pseudomonadota bacterium]